MRRHGRIGFWYRLAVVVVKPLLLLLTKRDNRHLERIPATGGVIIAANHISVLDPLTLGYAVYRTGRTPRYLAKSTLFEVPGLKWVMSGAGQIPVKRNTADAAAALGPAMDALRRGECLMIYPEGTATRDPKTWPMKARSGVARLALATGAPVIPVAQWGAHELMPYPQNKPRLLPRKTMRVLVGEPVDLSAWAGKEPTAEVLRAATEKVMSEITSLLEELRDEKAPAEIWDPRRGEAA